MKYFLLILTIFGTFDHTLVLGTMFGEPINPDNFEVGKLVVSKNSLSIEHYCKILPDTESTVTLRHRGPRLWPNGVVPYFLDSAFTDGDRAMIASAIGYLHKVTCVRVIPRMNETNYVNVKKSTSALCASSVGMIGNAQSLVFAERCVRSTGSILHEFMHSMGFDHEQSRDDRDDHVTVYYEHIYSSAKSQFKKSNNTLNANTSPYDLLSVMHYGKFAFSKDKKATMLAKNNQSNQLGQRRGLTEDDLLKINTAYNCNRKKPKSTDVVNQFMQNLTTSANGTEANSGQTSRTLFAFKQCADFDSTACSEWTRLGFCKKSEIFMTVYCKYSCKKCGIGCIDMRKECGSWAKKEYCNTYSEYMHHYCKKSCNLCT